jgi:hypothetical protein
MMFWLAFTMALIVMLASIFRDAPRKWREIRKQ